MSHPVSSNRARTLALQKRSFDLTCSIIETYPRNLALDEPSRVLWRQLIRASTSATLNLEEADAASSNADFLAKMKIAVREAKETVVAIRIIVRCKLARSEELAQHQDEANQLASIFFTIVKNKRENMKRED